MKHQPPPPKKKKNTANSNFTLSTHDYKKCMFVVS
jgi:hypothetical protein